LEQERSVVKKLFVKDLKPKADIESVFLVKAINLVTGRDGKDYLNLVFSDRSGEIEGRVWQQAATYAERFTKGDLISLAGKVNQYQGRRQIIVKSLKKLDQDKFDKGDFEPQSEFDSEEMYQELLGLVKKQKDIYIKELLLQVLQDEEIALRLKVWPAGSSIHHAYRSGLLEHILSCSKLAVSLSAHYQVNESYVLAGCILHDLCKIYELTEGPNADYTDEGKLVGHLVRGTEIVDRFSRKIKNFPYHMKLHLKHILLSHHGAYEYGSPKIPQTSEAMLVHQIDMMDSKLASFETAKKKDNTPGNWTGYIKHLDRIVYKSELPTFSTPKEPMIKKADGKGEKRTSRKRPSENEPTNSMAKLLEGIEIQED